MTSLNIWSILGIISILFFIFFGRNRGAVWGGLAGGIIVGLVIAIVSYLRGNVFPWAILMKAGIVGMVAGTLYQLGTMFWKKKKYHEGH
jgi:hypothetical protein